jgi:hypothetical protein
MQQTTFLSKLTNRPSIFLVLAALLIAMAAAPLTAGAHHKPGHAGGPPGLDELRDNLSIDFVDFDADHPVFGAGTFNGVFNITGFDVVDGQLFAVGTVVGQFVSSNPGHVIDVNENDVYALVGHEQGEERCPILFLELGPLFLDLLGLVIEIPDPIVLDIYATPGPGKLLGNLLCALVGILDGPTADNGEVGGLLGAINRFLGRLLG